MSIVKETYPVLGMECASCVRKIELVLTKTDGIKDASANLASEKITVEYDNEKINVKKLEEILKSMGYELIT
jgi:Cu+-exporting ATPase